MATTTKKKANTQTTKKRTPKAAPKEKPRVDGTVVTVELDGLPILVDFAPIDNFRIMRQARKGNVDAMLELIEGMLGDQIDEIEERFNLTTSSDWNEFIERLMGEVNPNS